MTLLLDIVGYCQRTKTSESVFGRASVGDPNLVRDMRRGMAVGTAREQWIRAAIGNHPEGLRSSERLFGAPVGTLKREVDRREVIEPIASLSDLRIAREAAANGSRSLLCAMLRLGRTMGGLPGLDAATFRQRCVDAGVIRAGARR